MRQSSQLLLDSAAGSESSARYLLLKNGLVADQQSCSQRDVLVFKGKIAAVAESIDISALDCLTMDINGLYLLPGGIDVHTHFNIDVGIAKSCDDFYSGTRSAACGGTTSIVDHMGFGPKGCDLFHQLEAYKQHAKDKAVIDYSFHGVIQHIDEQILQQMQPMVNAGISSFKLYLTYDYKLDDGDAYRALKQLKKVGALTTVHPENDAAIAINRAQLSAAGKTTPEYHPISRPLECEAEAISRMINLAKMADDAPLYIVHLSNGLGLDYARLARNQQQKVWVETCPQYLLLDDSYYQREDGEKFILSPPLRASAELDKLWQGLSDGSIDVVATDHCSFTWREQKQPHHDDFTRCPNGIPGVELRMPLLFSEGVMKGRLSLSQFVSLTSYQPAKLFGLYPQKGCLEVGADADLVIFDPQQSVSIDDDTAHDACDYSPYSGLSCQGWPVMTFSRGALVSQNGQFTGQQGAGKFIARQPFST